MKEENRNQIMSFPVYKSDVIYDGGGGYGSHTLSFQTLREGQEAMFSRTIQQGFSEFQRAALEQEKRQLGVQEALKTITVNVYREDFPTIRSQIPISYFPSAAQEVWGTFLANVCKALKIEFIHSILERGDKAPVNRILRLKDGFDYLIRQRESSAVLEVINSHQAPLEISWAVTKDILDVKRDLHFNLKHQQSLNTRIEHLVSQKMTHVEEKDFAQKILAAPRADMLVKLISTLYLDDAKTKKLTKEDGVRALNINYADIMKYEGKIDVVILHRLAIERLNRIFLAHENPALVVKQSIHYVVKLLADLKNEVEIITLGLKYISDVIVHTIPYRDYVFTAILDSMQHYVGPAAKHRPRHPKRLQHSNAAEYKFDDTLVTHAELMHKSQTQTQRLHTLDPTTLDPSLDVAKFTRYGEHATLIYDRAANRQVGNIIEQFAKEYEIDEQLRPITPRTKAKRMAEQRRVQEEDKKRKEDLLKPCESVVDSGWKPLHPAASPTAAVAGSNAGSRPVSGRRTPPTSASGPKMIIRNRERMDASQAKLALEEAMTTPPPPRNNRSPLMSSSKSSSQLQQSPSGSARKMLLSSSPSTEKKNFSADLALRADHTTAAANNNNSNTSRPSSSTSQRDDFDKLPSIVSNKPKAAKFRIRNGKDDPSTNTAAAVDGRSNADDAAKKRWKGTRGEIGKAPPDRKAEEAKLQAAAMAQIKKMQEEVGLVSIDDINEDGLEREERASLLPAISSARGGTPNNTSRPASSKGKPSSATADSVMVHSSVSEDKPGVGGGGIPEEKAPQLAVPSGAAETPANVVADTNEGIPTGEDSPDKSPKKGKKKKIVIKPLPVVECPKFRPYEAQMREAVVLIQAFASLLRLLNDNYGNREWAFRQHVVEEVAEIVLVCPSIPKVLDYFMDIIETMYAEGYRDIASNLAEQLMDIQLQEDRTMDNSMVLSSATPRSSLLQGSMVIEAMSEMTIPAINPDTRFDMIDAHDNIPIAEVSAAHMLQDLKPGGSPRSINAHQDKPEPFVGAHKLVVQPHHVPTAVANFGDKGRPVPGRKKPMTRNVELMKQIGESEFELRYVRTPADGIVTAISMCAAHVECGRHERDMAEYWLEVWNDNSRDYKNLVRKGKNLCAL